MRTMLANGSGWFFNQPVPLMDFVECMSNTSDNGVQGVLLFVPEEEARYFAGFAAYPSG